MTPSVELNLSQSCYEGNLERVKTFIEQIPLLVKHQNEVRRNFMFELYLLSNEEGERERDEED